MGAIQIVSNCGTASVARKNKEKRGTNTFLKPSGHAPSRLSRRNNQRVKRHILRGTFQKS